MKTNSPLLPADTSTESAIKQFEALMKMGIKGRACMTFELSNNLRAITESGIRQRHPDYTPEQVTMAVLKLTLDPSLFNEAFPDCEIVPWQIRRNSLKQSLAPSMITIYLICFRVRSAAACTGIHELPTTVYILPRISYINGF